MRLKNYSFYASILVFLISCGGGGSDPIVTTDPPVISNPPSVTLDIYTTQAVPGDLIYVEGSKDAADIEVRFDGNQLPIHLTVTPGAFYKLPTDLQPGTYTLGIRSLGETSDAASGSVEVTDPLFLDVTAETGLTMNHNINSEADPCMPISTGVGAGDFDGDGDLDIYVGNLGSAGVFYRNNGDTNGDGLPEFTDITSLTGLADIDNIASISFMDYDNDGDRDLFIGRWGADKLLQNRLVEDGFAEFVDVTEAMGIDTGDRRTQGSGWGDFDNDGDLDLYLVRHSRCGLGAIEERAPQDQFFRNDGDHFTDITHLLAGDAVHALGFSSVFVDYDMDGDQDLLVANDHISDNLSRVNALWRNDGPDPENPDGWLFTEVGKQSGFGPTYTVTSETDARTTVNAMGISVGDIDRDGWPDLTFTNIGPNYIMLNNGDGTFRDVSEELGIKRTDLPWRRASITWGTQLFDMDNDMDLDVFYAGGRIDQGTVYPNAMFRNDGMDSPWVDITRPAGLADMESGKATAILDLDRDGFMEFIVANYGGPLRAYYNGARQHGNTNNFLIVELLGSGQPGKTNRDALGAIVRLTTPDGITQTAFQTCKPSLGSGGELGCHFGLGTNAAISSLSVRWPTGVETTHTISGINQRIVIQEP